MHQSVSRAKPFLFPSEGFLGPKLVRRGGEKRAKSWKNCAFLPFSSLPPPFSLHLSLARKSVIHSPFPTSFLAICSDRSGSKLGPLMTVGQVKSVPEFAALCPSFRLLLRRRQCFPHSPHNSGLGGKSERLSIGRWLDPRDSPPPPQSARELFRPYRC